MVRIFSLTVFLALSAAYNARSMDLPSGPLTAHPGNPLVRNGPEPYDYWKTGPRAVLKEGPSNYRMWYEAAGLDNVIRVGYATSVDGLTWTKAGVVMWPTEPWERDEVSPSSVVFEDGVYKMWFHGGGYPDAAQGRRLGNAQIGYATSTDGLTWTKYLANPVIGIGPPRSFDDEQAAEPRIIKTDAGYRMYYTGRNTATSRQSLAMATSTDGINWTKYDGNPILTPNRFGGWGGAFILSDGIWNLWHAQFDDVSGLVYKWSLDGISWNDGPSNPVLTANGDSNAADAQAAGDSVSGYLDGTTYRIMYNGFNSNFRGTGRVEAICLATIRVNVPEPVARFSARCSGLTCILDGTASSGPNPIASYFWDLDTSPDGTAQGAVVAVTYPSGGTRNVTLTVTDTAGLSANITQQVTVEDPKPILADFRVNCFGLTCVLDGTASLGPSPPIVSYFWDLDTSPDGTAQGAVVAVTYPSGGTRNVTLTVTDIAGLSASVTKQVTVSSDSLIGEFRASCIELICVLDGTASSGPNPIASYYWDLDKFPDGTAEGSVVVVTYFHADPRNVTLTVTDIAGLSASSTGQIDVGSAPTVVRRLRRVARQNRGSVR